jgi:tetratricopeptide (TPR) repeat protein
MAHHLVLVMPCPTARAHHQALGLSRRRRGLTNAAQQKATAVVKRSRSIAFGSCSFYSAVNRSDEAIAEFERVLLLDRNLVYAHSLIGMAKTALLRAEEAENHYREALRA